MLALTRNPWDPETKRLAVERQAEAIRLRLEGHALDWIGKQLGVSRERVRQYTAVLGPRCTVCGLVVASRQSVCPEHNQCNVEAIKRRERRKKRQALKDSIVAMRADGFPSFKEIAARLGVSFYVVAGVCGRFAPKKWAKKMWNAADEQVAIDYSAEEAARILGIPLRLILCKRQSLQKRGLRCAIGQHLTRWTPERDAIALQLPASRSAALLGISPKAVYGRRQRILGSKRNATA